jgi:hypothetical protein
MFMSPRKGRTGIVETDAFIAHFALPSDPEKSLIITVDQFDRWGVTSGFLKPNVGNDERNAARNILRNKINNTASSPSWLADKKEPFHVSVKTHGINYRVSRTNQAFALKANKLPAEIKSLVKTKKNLLDQLHSSLDLEKLPIGLQLRITTLNREIERYALRIDFESQQLSQEFSMVQRDIARSMAMTNLLPTNGAAQAILDAKTDSESQDELDL